MEQASGLARCFPPPNAYGPSGAMHGLYAPPQYAPHTYAPMVPAPYPHAHQSSRPPFHEPQQFPHSPRTSHTDSRQMASVGVDVDVNNDHRCSKRARECEGGHGGDSKATTAHHEGDANSKAADSYQDLLFNERITCTDPECVLAFATTRGSTLLVRCLCGVACNINDIPHAIVPLTLPSSLHTLGSDGRPNTLAKQNLTKHVNDCKGGPRGTLMRTRSHKDVDGWEFVRGVPHVVRVDFMVSSPARTHACPHPPADTTAVTNTDNTTNTTTDTA